MAKKSKDSTAESKADSTFPDFDEKALSALTQKIEKGFKAPEKSQPPKSEKSKKNKNKEKGKKDQPTENAAKQQNQSTAEPARGKKRDAKGKVKAEKANGDAKPQRQGPKESKGAASVPTDRKVLLQEILAMGGTEEDLALVGDAASDDEETPAGGKNSAVDAKLKKELADFAAGLGLEGLHGAALEAEDPEVEEEEVEEDEEAEEDEEEVEADEWENAESEPEDKPTPAKNTQEPSKGSSKESSRLIFEPRPDWHAAPLPPLPSPSADSSLSYPAVVKELKAYAKSLLEEENNLYSSKHISASSSHRFLSTIMSSGTLSDKISALTLVVQESPVHTTKSCETLLGLASKRSRSQAVSALGTLKDLLGTGVVLPADRRLRTFETQPGLVGTLQQGHTIRWKSGDALPGKITKAHLVSWAYEDWLKDMYFEVLKVLESWCNDEIEFARSRAITYVFELLKEKPEQEANLLRLLVNKIGDPDKKIASRASYLILQLQTTHPAMKPIIISSIEQEVIQRPGQSLHAKYYAINTLNQTILSLKEEPVARKLLDIYFDLFVTLLKSKDPQPAVLTGSNVVNKKGELQGGGGQKGRKALKKEEEAKLGAEEFREKVVSAVLTGVNRAIPFAGNDDATLLGHMDTLFRITHSSNFNTSIQALMLIQQLISTRNIASDRFYRTLYESLLDPRLITSSKHALYLNVLFKALRSDLNVKRVKAFAKRLLQILALHQPPFICGSLFLIHELLPIFPSLRSLLNEPEASGDDDEEVFRDVPEDGEEAAQPAADNLALSQNRYDGRKRDPEHSNADKSCLWEVLPLDSHFHPSVSIFASTLLSGTKPPAKPDLASHSLINFLDKFVYRNAKAPTHTARGSSIMQPLAGADKSSVLVSSQAVRRAVEPLNSGAFFNKKIEDVAADEVFFHEYFHKAGKAPKASAKESKKAEDGEEGSDEEDEIWQALVESKPDIEGPSDDDDEDLDMMDLDDSDAGSMQWEDEDDLQSDMDDESDGGVELNLDSDEDEDMLPAEEEAASEDEEEADAEKEAKESGKGDSRRAKKRKLKSLPTFASMDDYAHMMKDDEEDL